MKEIFIPYKNQEIIVVIPDKDAEARKKQQMMVQMLSYTIGTIERKYRKEMSAHSRGSNAA